MASKLQVRTLGWSGEKVSSVALGTMTFGIQTDEEDAHKQMDYYCKEMGGNLIDTAELYPTPSSDSRWYPGRTEEIVGRWLAKNTEMRSKVFIATKVMGYNSGSDSAGNRKLTLGTGGSKQANGLPSPIPARLDRESVLEAAEASLKRLQTNYIDLYQIHWPDRYLPTFGRLMYNPDNERESVPITETLLALKELMDNGKIKYYGLSNESTFGVCQWCQAADQLGCPRPVSIQNQFSLLYRPFESELAEACAKRNYDIALLPWTPLAGGLLTGKYCDKDSGILPKERWPENTRHSLYSNFMSRFLYPRSTAAVSKYDKLAKKHDMTLLDLSLKFCLSRWYATSTIIGARTIDQLKETLSPFEENQSALSDEILQEIDEIHLSAQNPIMSA